MNSRLGRAEVDLGELVTAPIDLTISGAVGVLAGGPGGLSGVRNRRSGYSVAAASIGFAQLSFVIGAFALSTWDGNRPLDSTAARWWMAAVVAVGLVVATFVLRGSVFALGLVAFAELWIVQWGLNAHGLDGVAWMFVVGSSLAVIVMCLAAIRWARTEAG